MGDLMDKKYIFLANLVKCNLDWFNIKPGLFTRK
jgi:hypothetical protein